MLTQQTRFDVARINILMCICISTVNLAFVGCSDGEQTPSNNSTTDTTSGAVTSPKVTSPDKIDMPKQTQSSANSKDESKSKEIRALIEKLYAQKKVPEGIIHIPSGTLTGYTLNSDGKVQVVLLAYCPVTNEDVAEICKLKTIERLVLTGTKITDAAFEHIDKLKLKYLALRHTQITKNSIVHMKEMKTLTELALPKGFDEESKAELQKALPDCKILINNNFR